MSEITFKGSPIQTLGDFPSVGSAAPDFTLVKQDLSELSLKDSAGKKVLLNIFPSIDTPVCAFTVKSFNEKVSVLENTVVLCVSMDLPFAQARFCGTEGIELVETASAFRSDFGKVYGVEIADGPLACLFARAVIVIDGAGNVVYTELIPEITEGPNYEDALASLQ